MEYPRPTSINEIYNPSNYLEPSEKECSENANSEVHSDFVKKTGDIMSGSLRVPQLNFSDSTSQTTAFTTTYKNSINTNNSKLTNLSYDLPSDTTHLHNLQITGDNGMQIYQSGDRYVGKIGGVVYDDPYDQNLYISGNLSNNVFIRSGSQDINLYGRTVNIGSPWGGTLKFTADNSVQTTAFTSALKTQITNNNTDVVDLKNKTKLITSTAEDEDFLKVTGLAIQFYRQNEDETEPVYIGKIGGVNSSDNKFYISGNQTDDMYIYSGPQNINLFGKSVIIGSPWGGVLKFSVDNSIQTTAFTSELKTQISTTADMFNLLAVDVGNNINDIDELERKVDINTDSIANMSNTTQPLMPVGSIIAFAGVSPPSGWLLCNGSARQIANYQALYDVIGTLYTVNTIGDNSQFDNWALKGRFRLPDLQNSYIGMSGQNTTHEGFVNEPDRAIGTYAPNTVQTHSHTYYSANSSTTISNSGGSVKTVGSNNYQEHLTTDVQNANGETLVNTVTKPHSITMNYIIKY
jgi:microcystin-dependent protein